MTYGVLGAFAAFGLIALMWDRLGLKRMFEVPWFGVGEDVENVGPVESVIRAAVFVLFVWFVLGMGAIAWLGVRKQALCRTSGTAGSKPESGPAAGQNGATGRPDNGAQTGTNDAALVAAAISRSCRR